MDTVTEAGTSRFVTVQGIKIHYNEVGTGAPLLCLHGGGPGATSWSNFKQNIAAFTPSYRMLMMDMPGYGKSAFPDGCTTDFFDFMGEIIEGFLAAVGVTGPVDVIGNSLGGQAALGLELRAPKRMRHAVLIGSQPTSAGIVIQPQPQEAIRNIFKFYEDEGPTLEKMRRLIESLLFDASMVSEETLKERYEAGRDPGQMRLIRLPRRDLYPELGKIACPTLLVWGQEDKGGALEVGLQMLKKFQNARMVIFQRCGHWAQVEHQKEFEREVLSFFST